MDISKLTGLAIGSSSSSDAMKQSLRLERQWSDALKPALELNRRFDEVAKLMSSSALLGAQCGASQLAKEMADQSRHWKKLTEPLSQIRESMLFSDHVAKTMVSSALAWQSTARELAESLSVAFSTMRMAEEISKQMMHVSALRLERFAEITKPYQGLLDSISGSSFAALAASKLATRRSWVNQLQPPVIDGAAASAIAAMWGKEGVERQLKFFGIEYHQLFVDLQTTTEEKPISSQFKIPPIDFWTAFSILLAILMFLYQARDSAQTESRLSSQLQLSRDETQNSLRLIGQVLQTLIESRQPNEEGEIQFVVRSRVATIRTTPSAGSTAVAEIFPNQVVTLKDARGKWIQVQYFDWLNHEVRTGWVLKKYLVRVPTFKSYATDKVSRE